MSQNLVFMTDTHGISFTKNVHAHVHAHKSIDENVQKGCMLVNAAFIQQESFIQLSIAFQAVSTCTGVMAWLGSYTARLGGRSCMAPSWGLECSGLAVTGALRQRYWSESVAVV